MVVEKRKVIKLVVGIILLLIGILSWFLFWKDNCNKENPQIVGKYTNIAKLVASEFAYKACDVAIQVHGGYGFVTEYDIITCPAWLRTARIASVNNEMVLNFIGQHILGLPKSY